MRKLINKAISAEVTMSEISVSHVQTLDLTALVDKEIKFGLFTRPCGTTAFHADVGQVDRRKTEHVFRCCNYYIHINEYNGLSRLRKLFFSRLVRFLEFS